MQNSRWRDMPGWDPGWLFGVSENSHRNGT